MKIEHNAYIVFYSRERKKIKQILTIGAEKFRVVERTLRFSICHVKIQIGAHWCCPRHGCVNFYESAVKFSVI